ncbi:hypothetical protein AC578_2797 [Pseudocercospora eumusae]|uniref:BTB domain-containing protein n=1 Tax=Pseudocercospora eumusae TaxID=321146 RepID=A0A139HGU8_9PEZI|nr:hypothetical protein AC578_2797 [Pseudocercospora eumusae]
MMVAEETPASDILEKLFESGEWSDFQIATPTKTFKVHRNIVSSACPFFAAACKRDWKEGSIGTIALPEDEKVIYCLVRYMYGLEWNLWSEYQIEYEYEIMCLFETGIAADKASTPYYLDFTARLIAQKVAGMAQSIILRYGGEAWNDLSEEPELLRDVMVQLSKREVRVYEVDEDLTAEYLKDPKSK